MVQILSLCLPAVALLERRLVAVAVVGHDVDMLLRVDILANMNNSVVEVVDLDLGLYPRQLDLVAVAVDAMLHSSIMGKGRDYRERS